MDKPSSCDDVESPFGEPRLSGVTRRRNVGLVVTLVDTNNEDKSSLSIVTSSLSFFILRNDIIDLLGVIFNCLLLIIKFWLLKFSTVDAKFSVDEEHDLETFLHDLF